MKHITWADDIYTGLQNLGGEAHLRDIYVEVRRIRLVAGRSVPQEFEATIRQALESHCQTSSNFRGVERFEMVAKGSGLWRLK